MSFVPLKDGLVERVNPWRAQSMDLVDHAMATSDGSQRKGKSVCPLHPIAACCGTRCIGLSISAMCVLSGWEVGLSED